MNERIRELKEQAFNFVAEQNMTKKEYFWENIRHNRTLQDRVDEKFAELIVRECIELFPERHYYYSGPAVKRDIKKHFGVE